MVKRDTLLDLIDRLTPDVQRAFLEAIGRITTQAQIRALEDAIRAGDASAVLRVLDLDRGQFTPLDRAFRDAYLQFGDWTMAGVALEATRQGARVTGYFDARNMRAERYMAEQSSRLITGPEGLMDDIRENVRRVLTDGMVAGTSPRTAALNLVGRIDPLTGTRTGGVIGMSARDMDRVDSVKAILSDPNGPRGYFIKDRKTGAWKPRYKGTDRRFDKRVLKAIEDGKPLSKSDIQEIERLYRGRLLKQRGETIARAELLGSGHHAQDEGLQQMVDSGKVRSEAIDEEWDASNDSATRDSHRFMDGQQRKFGEDFVTGLGNPARRPGDERLPPEDRIGCRCIKHIRINFAKGLRDRMTPDQLAAARAAIANE